MVTLKDIAEKCGVSISAVSLAIHKPHRISIIQKENILKTAHEMGYFQKKHPAMEKVLIVADNFHDCYFGEYYNKVIFGILESLYREHISVQILSRFDVEYSDIYDNNGIVFVGKVPLAFIRKAQEFRLPFVLCGHPAKEINCNSLRFNIERGTWDLLEYISSCGHKNIGVVLPAATESEDYIVSLLHNSIKESLIKLKIKERPQLFAQASFSNLQTVETALNMLLKAKPRPSIIFCTSDHFAYIAYQILKKWKVRIPQDISIVGFDGISIPLHLETPTPILTTVATDQIEMGRASVALLKKIIINRPENEIREILPIRLRIGDSVQRI